MNGLSRETAQTIEAAAIRYYAKRYSFASYFRVQERKPSKERKEDTTQFCSSLIAYAYREAGIELIGLADKRVLPIDLYQVCQTEKCLDASGDFDRIPLPHNLDEVMGNVTIPGRGELTFTELLENLDAIANKMASLQKDFHEVKYSATRQIIYVEGLLAQLCNLQFDEIKQLAAEPGRLDDGMADYVVQVLRGIDSLLELSLLVDIGDVIQDSMINSVAGKADVSLYAGFPTPHAVREMQKVRATVTVFASLQLAEIGLLTILAHNHPSEKLAQFRVAKKDYAVSFLDALGPINDLDRYQDGQSLFKWIADDDDRGRSIKILERILLSLRFIEIGRRESASDENRSVEEIPSQPQH